jgi:hypothetical protein
MRGTCLCGGISFEVLDPPRRLYQCHCSLCRKQGGAAANASLVVKAAQLRWLSGESLIRSYVKPTGFRSDFCSTCGSPVPNRIQDTSFMWVPAGLLDDVGTLEIAMHLFVGSKAAWEPAPTTGAVHETMPGFRDVLACLRGDPGT